MESKQLPPFSWSILRCVMFAPPLFSLWPPKGRIPALKSKCRYIIVEIVCTKESPSFLICSELQQERMNSATSRVLLPQNLLAFCATEKLFFFLQPLHIGNMRRLRTHSWPAHQLRCTQPWGLRQPTLWSQMADSAFIMSCFHRLFFFLLLWCFSVLALYFWRLFLLPFTSREALLK